MATAHHGPSGPSKGDLPGRLSFVSSTSQPKELEDGSYTPVKSPDPNAVEGGALREGGAPDLKSKDSIGLLVQYAAVGLNYGVLPATIYPFLQQYLNASGTQVTTASTLLVLPWSFKCFYGILSDCVPLWGYRRRPWMVIGWVICLVMLLIMACMPAGDPYYTVASDRDIKPADYTPEIQARINFDAASQSGKYVLLMFFAAVGYVLSDVCADSIVVDFAQREPMETRGKTQSAIYVVRTVFVIIGQFLTGFCFNGEEYGGDFDFSLTFPQLMIILAVLTAPVIPMTWFFIKEEKMPRVDFKNYMTELWELIQKRAMYQVVFFNFFQGLFSSISYTASSPVASYMVGVTPINSTLSDIFGNLLFMAGIMVTSKWGLHWNWRWMIMFTGVFVMIVDGITTFITIWDVFRSQWFWLGLPVAVQLPYGVGWMISTFVIVELSGVGNEGVVYGLITMVSNLSSPFATAMTLVIDQPFDLTTERIQADDTSIRKDVTYAVIIMYAMTAFSWVFLVFLPKQKEETQELLRSGGSSKLLGALTVAYLTFAFVWSLMTNFMAMFDSTSCLIIAGGSGC
ncbi:Folate-Biopterin Transporter (FBT) Family [Phytophthora cinnamomi]|uniref:Folate-Biopterin Transporter (FBT) Family n=2 Tax=Phytophthora cinnamomi TaxID=4785 RepID=UPI00355A1A73|nr:Folate-Biopterin Transporter (FBT) Family [Phytophthora cinnamomi]